MGLTALAYILGLIIASILLFGSVYFVIMLTDLECDYINPIDLANTLNLYVLPEIFTHAIMTLMFLLVGQWLTFFLNLPLVVYNVIKVANKRHFYDATEVFRTLSKHKRENFIKVGFYLLLFFYFLYCMIITLVAESS